jgi:hypothetical protein
MTQDEFLAFAEETVPTFAAEKVEAGLWTPDEAPELSHKSFNENPPQGLATPNGRFFTIRDSA